MSGIPRIQILGKNHLPLDVDSATSALAGIDYAHHKIHTGDSY